MSIRRSAFDPPLLPEGKEYGAEGDRTPGLDSAIVALSQLSYCPVVWLCGRVV